MHAPRHSTQAYRQTLAITLMKTQVHTHIHANTLTRLPCPCGPGTQKSLPPLYECLCVFVCKRMHACMPTLVSVCIWVCESVCAFVCVCVSERGAELWEPDDISSSGYF